MAFELMGDAELEATSWKYTVRAASLTIWRDAFLQEGEDGLKCWDRGGGEQALRRDAVRRPESGEGRVRNGFCVGSAR